MAATVRVQTAPEPGAAAPEAPLPVTLAQALPVWARIAALSFGGPAGQIAVMHRILVEEKRWISENRFLHALNFCTLLPGPEAQQLATYVGWLMHGTRGGLVAGGLFVLPGIVAIMGLSWIYALYGNVGFVAGLFFGLKAAVLAIVLQAVIRIGKRALKGPVMVGLAAAAFVAIFFLDVPFPLIVLTAGVIGYLGGRAGLPQFKAGGHGGDGKVVEGPFLLDDHELPQERAAAGHTLRMLLTWGAIWLVPVAAILLALGPDNVFSHVAVFFSKMAMVTFGAPTRCSPTSPSRRSSITAGSSPARCSTVSAWPRRRPGRSSWSRSSWASWRRSEIPGPCRRWSREHWAGCSPPG